MASAFRFAVIPVFATTVFAFCAFTIIGFMGRGGAAPYDYFAALACAMISLIVNYRFSLRERSLVSLTVLNAALVVISVFVVLSAPNSIEGFWPHAITAVCAAAPVIHGMVLSQGPVKTGTAMLYCDISILGTIFLFGIQVGEIAVPAFTNGLSVAALLLNLFLLSVLRGKGPAKKEDGRRKEAAKGAVLTAVLAGIVFAAAIVAIVLLPVTRAAILAAAAGARGLFIFVGEAIERFFMFLYSLFPASQGGPVGIAAPDTGTMGDMDSVMAGAGVTGLYTRVFIACAFAAAVIFVLVLFRFRKQRLLGRKANVFVYETDAYEGASPFHFLLSLPARFRAWLVFRKCRALRRGTYEDAYFVIAQAAKRRGVRRAASETQWAFLRRVADSCSAAPSAAAGARAARVIDHAARTDASAAEGVRAARVIDHAARTDASAAEGVGRLLATISAAADYRLYSSKDADYATLTKEDAASLAGLLAAIRQR